MRWSVRIARLSGIAIRVHLTFLLLPLWIGFNQYTLRGSWTDACAGMAFICVLFGIVVLHELAHAVTARRFGIGTRDITLLPIGGVARLERMPENPKEELLVAVAGPAVNLCLALFFFCLNRLGLRLAELATLDLPENDFVTGLMWVNICLVVFNLIPAFPMDGGRVLRALLAMRLSYSRATAVAAGVGQAMAFCFGLVGLASLLGYLGPLSNPFLLLIGVFVWVGARQEAGLVRLKHSLGSAPVHRMMIRDVRTLAPAQTLAEAVQLVLCGWQQDFPVIENGCLAGILWHRDLVDGLAQKGERAFVNEFMQTFVPTVPPELRAEDAMLKLRAEPGRTLVVAASGQLHGLLTYDRLAEFLLLQSALGYPPRTRATEPPILQSAA